MEEVFFMESWHQAVHRVTQSIHSVSESMTKIHATPIFCTIPPCSFRIWNSHRLNKGNTSYLLHFNHYEDMQYSLISAIHQINSNIVQINSSNGVTTPHIATTVMDNRPDQRPRVHYSRLRDGVHATNELKKKWAKKMHKSMTSNRAHTPSMHQLMDSDTEEREYIEAMVMSHLSNA